MSGSGCLPMGSGGGRLWLLTSAAAGGAAREATGGGSAGRASFAISFGIAAIFWANLTGFDQSLRRWAVNNPGSGLKNLGGQGWILDVGHLEALQKYAMPD